MHNLWPFPYILKIFFFLNIVISLMEMILLLNKEIKKNYSYFLAEAFANIISFSMIYHITKFHLTTIFYV